MGQGYLLRRAVLAFLHAYPPSENPLLPGAWVNKATLLPSSEYSVVRSKKRASMSAPPPSETKRKEHRGCI
jgi:hypothetical protein